MKQSNEHTTDSARMDRKKPLLAWRVWMALMLLFLLNACAAAPAVSTVATTSVPPAATTTVPAATTIVLSPTSTVPAPTTAPLEATSTVPASTDAPPDATSTTIAVDEAQEQGDIYSDPQGQFSVPIPTNWQAEQRDGFVALSDPDQQISAYALVVPSDDSMAALETAWKQVTATAIFTPSDVLEPPPTNGVERTVNVSYESPEGRVVTGRGMLYEGQTYVLLIDADPAAYQKRNAQVQVIESGYAISAIPVVDLRGVTPARIDATITAELAAFTERIRQQYRVPGVTVAVVQDGEVVYSEGFGVRNAATNEPITPQTRMMIGSTGKSLTTMMMATLVDEGKMNWDTPAHEILPSFAVKDPALTEQVTMRNLVCACTGVPRRDLEIIFNSEGQDAEDVIASLASFEFFTDIGEAFQYSNQMVATGGYVATVAAGHEPGNLLEDYGTELKARVLDPIGMPNTTLSFDEVEASDNYAVPHSPMLELDAVYRPRPLAMEEALKLGGPAGVHWSTTEDMANYLITELNRGVAPNGNRVVSAENLEETWQPQIPVDATTDYGLGWFVGDYKQQRLISHGGNTLGFTSDFAFLPEANLGIVVVANGQSTNVMNEAIRARLFELAFAQPATAEATATFAHEQATAQVEALSATLTDTWCTPWKIVDDRPKL